MCDAKWQDDYVDPFRQILKALVCELNQDESYCFYRELIRLINSRKQHDSQQSRKYKSQPEKPNPISEIEGQNSKSASHIKGPSGNEHSITFNADKHLQVKKAIGEENYNRPAMGL